MRAAYSNKYSPPAPVVTVTIRSPEGKTADLEALIDSGADITVFPKKLLDELRLLPGSSVLVQGYDGSLEEHYSYFIEIEIQGIARSMVEAIAGEDMLLGRNFLSKLNVTLKGKEREVEVSDPQ